MERCRNRQPTTRLEIMPTIEEPMSESLRDVDDLSLRFSIDVDVKGSGELDGASRQKELIETLTQMASSSGKSAGSYFPGRRQGLYVVATDCYNSSGFCSETLSTVIQNVTKAAGSKAGQIGFVLLTGLTLQETREVFKTSQLNIEDFDALICSSGSEMYFPWRDLVLDKDYEGHIEYRWPAENVRSMVMRLAMIGDDTEGESMHYMSACSSRCYSYSIKPGTKVKLFCVIGSREKRLKKKNRNQNRKNKLSILDCQI